MLDRICIIILVNLVFYYRTIKYDYVSDDSAVSRQTEPIPKNFWQGLWYQFWGHRYLNAKHAHLMTLALHIINCILIYTMLYIMSHGNIGFLTALLFSINPINMQGGAIWLSGKGYSYTTTATLLMFIIPQIAPVFYFSMLYLAPNGWFTPLGFLGTPWWWLASMIPLLFLTKKVKAVLHHKVHELGTKTVNTEMEIIKLRKVIPFIKSFGYYFRICLVPYRLGLYHSLLYGFGTNTTDNKKGYSLDRDFWIGLFIGLGIITHIILFRNLISWGLWWFSVNIAMWCNLRTIQQQISERYCYLANIGLMLVLGIIGYYSPVFFFVVFTFYATRLWFAMHCYMSDYWMIEHNLCEIPSLHYTWVMRGVKKFNYGDFKGAYHDFCEAHQHKPYDLKVLFNIASCLIILGDPANARKFLDETRKNVYDELESEVAPMINDLESQLVILEEGIKNKLPGVNLNMEKLRVVR